MDVLALLIFGVVLFPNVDGLVDLAVIDAFLAYHHSKESLVVAILADLFDTFDLNLYLSFLGNETVRAMVKV